MDQLRNFGYPMPGDNVFIKPVAYTQKISLAAGFHTLFNSADNVTSNKKFPLSGNEIFVLESIEGLSMKYLDALTVMPTLLKSYLQIIINQREKLKIPLSEIITFTDFFTVGNTTKFFSGGEKTKERKLKFPIVINSNDNVQIRIYWTYENTIALHSAITLNGYSFDKLNSFEYDERKNKDYEQLSFSIYDYVSLDSNTAKEYPLFNVSGKTENLFSRGLDFANGEAFQLENIQIFGYSDQAGATYNLGDIYNSLSGSCLRVLENSKEVLNIKNPMLFSLVRQDSVSAASTTGTDTFGVNKIVSTDHSYTLRKPVVFSANSNVQAMLYLPDLYLGSPGQYYLKSGIVVDFKGTLTRKVS